MIREHAHRLECRIGQLGARLLYRGVWDGREFDGFRYRLEGTRLVVSPDGDEVDEEYLRDLLRYSYTLVGFICGVVGMLTFVSFVTGLESDVAGRHAWAAIQWAFGLATLACIRSLRTMPELEIVVDSEVGGS